MSMLAIPSWSIPGVVAEVRELKTKDQKTIWAYGVKVLAMGGTFECTTQDEKMARSAGVGSSVVVSGRFEQFQGAIKLVLQSVKGA